MKRKHLLSWGGVLTRFFTIQLLVQAANAVTGIAIIRILSKQDYAFYSIATSFMFSAAALTDCGISAALSALGGTVWEDGEALGKLINSALSIRRWLVAIVVLGVGVTAPLMFLRDGASLISAFSFTGVLITSLLFQFGTGVFGIVPQLFQDQRIVKMSQGIQVVKFEQLFSAASCAFPITLVGSVAKMVERGNRTLHY